MRDLHHRGVRAGRGHSIIRRGFSLIEILIVVVILALVAGLSYPSIRSTMGEQALSDGANEVLNALQFGYLQAQGRGRSQVLRFTLSEATPGGRIQFQETDGWSCSNPSDREDVEDVVFPPLTDGGEVAIVEMSPEAVVGAGICFKPNGRAYTGNGAIPILDDDSYNAPRSSTIGLRLRRFMDLDGTMAPVGIKKEIHLIHAGVAQLNLDLAL